MPPRHGRETGKRAAKTSTGFSPYPCRHSRHLTFRHYNGPCPRPFSMKHRFARLARRHRDAATAASRTGRAADYDELVAKHAQANRVPEALVHRVIVRESRYQPDLVGRGGTIGLMQIKLADRARPWLHRHRRRTARSRYQSHLRGEVSRRRLSRRERRSQPRGVLLCQRLLLRRQTPACSNIAGMPNP